MSDDQFDLAIVDPPYGVGAHKPCGQRNNGFQEFIKHKKNWDKEPPNESYFSLMQARSKNQIIWGANFFIKYIDKPLELFYNVVRN